MTTIAKLTTNTEGCEEEANLANVWFWKDYLLLADLEKAHSSREGGGGIEESGFCKAYSR